MTAWLVALTQAQEDTGKTWGTCPYAEEIHDDSTPCFCTDEERQSCADDV